MDEKIVNVEDVKSVLRGVGIKPEEYAQCAGFTSPKLDKPLVSEDVVLAELTLEEEGFFRCMGYAFEEKVVDTMRLKALYETFWIAMRSLHDLPLSDLAVKQGKFIVPM
jgi:hypothetical protein